VIYSINVWNCIPNKASFFFLFINVSRLASGPGILSPEVCWLEHEADHSPSSNAEVRKMGLYIYFP
jgi:hypothetical protein